MQLLIQVVGAEALEALEQLLQVTVAQVLSLLDMQTREK
jgi:hypothetical protein